MSDRHCNIFKKKISALGPDNLESKENIPTFIFLIVNVLLKFNGKLSASTQHVSLHV